MRSNLDFSLDSVDLIMDFFFFVSYGLCLFKSFFS